MAEKENILAQKAKSFIPTAREELKGILLTYLEKTQKRFKFLKK